MRKFACAIAAKNAIISQFYQCDDNLVNAPYKMGDKVVKKGFSE